jgi:flagellar hook-length control protein FliK
VVITITAYTEPVPVSPAPAEPQPVQENEENEEHSSFAEILAALQRSAEAGQTPDIQQTELLDAQSGIEVLNGENSDAEINEFSLYANANEKIEEGEDLFDSELFAEQQSVFLSAEHLFTRLEQASAAEELDGDFSLEISARQAADMETEEVKDFSAFMDKSEETEDAAKMYAVSKAAADQNSEESSSAANNKKEALLRTALKSENTETPHAKEKPVNENFVSHNKPEESRSRLEEARSRSRKDKISFEVRDLRTASETNVSNNRQMRVNAALEGSSGRSLGDASLREITLELRLPDYNSGASGQNAAQTSWETRSSSALENMLARELHQNFNGDIVRHASMALRDGGEGTIRIALRPESLGNVKIRLEMTDNRITGHIVVESEEALNAFKKEIASLEQSFRDSGFTDANLNLSLTADEWGAENQEHKDRSFLPRTAASQYDSSFEQETAPIIDVFFRQRAGSINLLA